MRLALANETDAAAAHSKSVLDGPYSESLLGFVLTVGPVPVHTRIRARITPKMDEETLQRVMLEAPKLTSQPLRVL